MSQASLRSTSPAPSSASIPLSPEEAYLLGAKDPIWFAHTFFPKAARQASPAFHAKIAYLLEAPGIRYAGVEVFRGSAKTTLARILGLAKRCAYGLSRTILLVGASQADARRTVRWMQAQIIKNRKFSEFFGLKKGEVWSADHIEIKNEHLDQTINIVAVGLTGSIRGLNLEDWRPDFILVDDPCDEENTATDAMRRKTEELFTGAIVPALAPASETAHAKIVMLQTGLDNEDLIHKAHGDPLWTTIKIPIFQYDDQGEPLSSSWPERWTLEELLELKQSYISRGMIHTWYREHECKITSPESALFNTDLVKFWDELPERLTIYCAIDPASSEAKDAHKSAIVFMGFGGGAAYLLDYYEARGKNPEELWQAFFSRAMRWRPRQLGVESIAYQRMLAWYFEQKMRDVNTFFAVRQIQDRRKKSDRIVQAHGGRIAMGQLYIHKRHTEYLDYLSRFTGEEDFDLLDAGAMALEMAIPTMLAENFLDADYEVLYQDEPQPAYIGGAP